VQAVQLKEYTIISDGGKIDFIISTGQEIFIGLSPLRN
jgi:hypothetical protein